MKRHLLSIVAILLLALLLASCVAQNPSEPSSPKTADIPTVSNAGSPPTSLPSIVQPPIPPVDEHVQRLIDLMEAGDSFIASLQCGEQPSNPDQNNRESDAVTAFTRFFDLDTLYVSGVDCPVNGGGDSCTISGFDEYNMGGSVPVYFSSDGTMQWYCPMAEYLPIADHAIEVYLDILRYDDASALAAWVFEYGVNEEDVAYAQGVIQMYRRYLDFTSTEITSVSQVGDRFRYYVLTASGATLEAEFAYGDNLCVPVLPEKGSYE